MPELSPFKAEEPDAFRLTRNVATRAKHSLRFVKDLERLGELHNIRIVTDMGRLSVDVVTKDESRAVMEMYPDISMSTSVHLLSRRRSKYSGSRLGDFVRGQELGDVVALPLNQTTGFIGARVLDDNGDFAEDRVESLGVLSAVVKDEIVLPEQSSFYLSVAEFPLEDDGEQMSTVVDFVGERMPQTIDLFDVQLYAAALARVRSAS